MSDQASTTKPRTREETLHKMAEHTAELQKENPELDLSSAEEWWAPGINFSYDCQVRLL